MFFIKLMREAVRDYLSAEKGIDSSRMFLTSPVAASTSPRPRSASIFSTGSATTPKADTGTERAKAIWSKLKELETRCGTGRLPEEWLLEEFIHFSSTVLSDSTKLKGRIESAIADYQKKITAFRQTEYSEFLNQLFEARTLKWKGFPIDAKKSLAENLRRYVVALAPTFKKDHHLFVDRVLFSHICEKINLAEVARFLSTESKGLLPQFKAYPTSEGVAAAESYEPATYFPDVEKTITFFSELIAIHCMLQNPHPDVEKELGAYPTMRK